MVTEAVLVCSSADCCDTAYIGWHFQLSASVGPVDVASRPTPYLAGLAVLAKAARYILGLGGEKMEIVAVEMAK